jgi:hypothetical protein
MKDRVFLAGSRDVVKLIRLINITPSSLNNKKLTNLDIQPIAIGYTVKKGEKN